MTIFTRASRMTGRRYATPTLRSASRPLFLFALVAIVAMAAAPQTWANVTGEGDVSPTGPDDLPLGGGTATADVIVGDTALGRLTIDAPAFTDPLNSPNGFIGNGVNGIGQVTVSGFDLDQSEWDVDLLLTIGVLGQGFLDLTGGGKVSVGDDSAGTFGTGSIIVGDQPLAQGFATVSGFGSQLGTLDLMVANEGFGTLDVSGGGSLRTEVASIGVMPNSIGKVTLTEAGTRWTHAASGVGSNNLLVGEEGRGTLEILDGALLTLAEDARISDKTGSQGLVTVSGPGSLWQVGDDSGTDNLEVGRSGTVGELHIDHDGMVRVDDNTTVSASSVVELDGGTLHSTTLTNSGILRGDGRLESPITNSAGGSIRNAASATNLRERLLTTGAVTNDGLIESLGGEMEFQSAVTNNAGGQILGRDAVLRFQGGLVNDGDLVLGGDTTVHGAITGSGDISVLSDSAAVIVGDLALSAASALSLTVGSAAGTLDVVGTADLGSSLLLLDYSSGVGAQPGDTYQIFSATDGISGTFGNTTTVAGGLVWNILVNPTTVSVMAGLAAAPLGADFNGDGIVDGQDLLIWEQNFGTMGPLGDANGDGIVDGLDFLKLQQDFGGPPTPLLAAVAAVPEPSTLLLALAGLAILLRRRKELRIADCGLRNS